MDIINDVRFAFRSVFTFFTSALNGKIWLFHLTNGLSPHWQLTIDGQQKTICFLLQRKKGKHFLLFPYICPITRDNFVYGMPWQIHSRTRNVHNANRNDKLIKAVIRIIEYQISKGSKWKCKIGNSGIELLCSEAGMQKDQRRGSVWKEGMSMTQLQNYFDWIFKSIPILNAEIEFEWQHWKMNTEYISNIEEYSNRIKTSLKWKFKGKLFLFIALNNLNNEIEDLLHHWKIHFGKCFL